MENFLKAFTCLNMTAKLKSFVMDMKNSLDIINRSCMSAWSIEDWKF